MWQSDVNVAAGIAKRQCERESVVTKITYLIVDKEDPRCVASEDDGVEGVFTSGSLLAGPWILRPAWRMRICLGREAGDRWTTAGFLSGMTDASAQTEGGWRR